MTSPDVSSGQDPQEISAPPPLKSGLLTSEFWITVIVSVLSLLTAMNVISPGFADRYKAQIDAVAFLASSIAPLGYALARGIAKRGHQQAVATVLAARIANGYPVALPNKRRTPRHLAGEMGYGLIETLLLIVGLILLIVGVIKLIVAAIGPGSYLSVSGLILAIVGAVIVVVVRGTDGRLRL